MTRNRFIFFAIVIIVDFNNIALSAEDGNASASISKKQSIPAILKKQTGVNEPNSRPLEEASVVWPSKPIEETASASEMPSGANPNIFSNVSSESGKNTVDAKAFSDTVHRMMPLSPKQIRALHYFLDRSQRAASAYPSFPPKPTSASILVNLSPGATPPIARLSLGFITSLVFLDATGASWPIEAYDLGDPGSFNIQWNKKDNKLLVQALKNYKFGNLAVILKGLDTPVLITLIPGQNAVDYRLDLHIPARGPKANVMLGGLPDTVSPQLLSVLNGVPPAGSKALKIEGGAAEGWLLGDRVFLRTRMTVLSPAWISTLSSADRTHAYELQSTPVVLVLHDGKAVNLKIEGL